MKSVLDHIKDRVLPSEFIGKYVSLKKKGHEHQGVCPFHQEKTPSFTVNDDKGFFHCFGCHVHGGVIDFLMKIENLDFKEAIKKLGKMYGIDTRFTEENVKQNTEITQIESVLETAKNWFLKDFENNTNAKNYLSNRKLSLNIAKKFEIGSTPKNYSDLLPYLRKVGFSDDIIVKAGLAWKSDNGKVVDSFIDRVMIPIYNLKGKVVAFGGRTLDIHNKNIAKYKNSHESPVFKKRETVYNLHRVKQQRLNKVIIAEGYMDVIAFSKIGIDYAVAPLGTALTPEQMQLIWKFDKEPIFCFDGDSAGINGMYKAFIGSVAKFLTPENGIKFIILPDNKDPDDLINSDPKKMEDLLANPMEMADFIWLYHFERSELPKTIENLTKIDNEIHKTIKEIGDSARREHFKAYLKQKLRAENFKLTRITSKWHSNKEIIPNVSVSTPQIVDKDQRWLAHAIYLLNKYHEELAHIDIDFGSLNDKHGLLEIEDVEILKEPPYKILIPSSINSENVIKYFNYYYKSYLLDLLNDNLQQHFHKGGFEDPKKTSLIQSEIVSCRRELELLKSELFI
ncbi:MAG: DNA primase [Alphaproteobacteria bacterium]|nr:DNA primase [Alphaproteobacteria bacterium]OJV17245.1 MAG: DNA primase [Alphaproteobacteria bacterium 33-17]